MRKTRLIATVGVSIPNGFERFKGQYKDYSEATYSELITASKNQEPEVKELNLGAEISTINEMIKQNLLTKGDLLYLLSSDTPKGIRSSEIVKEYYEDYFSEIEIIILAGLNPKDNKTMSDEGIRSLIQGTVEIVRQAKNNHENSLISATGGLKIQTSFISIIGQLLDIPVYYLYEGSDNIIRLPQMPINFDRQLWEKYFNEFNKLSQTGKVQDYLLSDAFKTDHRLKKLYNIHGNTYELSSVGLFMHEFFLINEEKHSAQIPSQTTHSPSPKSGQSNQRGAVNFPESIPPVFKTKIDSLLRLDYVSKLTFIRSKKGFKGIDSFEHNKDKANTIDASYFDGRHTWFYEITLNPKDESDINKHLIDLHMRYTKLPYVDRGKSMEKFDVDVLLIRHAEHEGEIDDKVEGFFDFKLTEKGERQAEILAERLQKEYNISHLYTSSLQRASKTADIVGEKLNLKPTRLDDLRAMNYGKQGGLSKIEANILFPKRADSKLPHVKAWGSESMLEFSLRFIQIFYEIVQLHQGETIAIITHGRGVSTIFREVMKLSPTEQFIIESDNTSIHHIQFGYNDTFVHSINDTKHIELRRQAGEDV